MLTQFIFALTLQAVITSGFAGSLGRLKHNEPVTTDTFVRDVVRHSRRVAATYAVMLSIPWAASLLLNLGLSVTVSYFSMLVNYLYSWIALLFMFAPYAIIMGKPKLTDALRNSLQVWHRNKWTSLSFVAFSVSLPIVLVSPLVLVEQFLISGTWLSLITKVLDISLRVIIRILLIIATWEFVWRMTERTTKCIGEEHSGQT